MEERLTERRLFLKAGALGATATALASPAIAQDKRQWKMVTAWPKNLPGSGVAAQSLADRITTLSGGRFNALDGGVSERTARNWISGTHAPAGEYLIELMRNSDGVLSAVLVLAGRREAHTFARLDLIRTELQAMLKAIDMIEGQGTAKHD